MSILLVVVNVIVVSESSDRILEISASYPFVPSLSVSLTYITLNNKNKFINN